MLADLLGDVDALVHLPPPKRRLQALLLNYPCRSRAPLRRGARGCAARVARDSRRRGATGVHRSAVDLLTGSAVRLRAVYRDELGRVCEQVLHVVLPAEAPGSVVQRVQWIPGHPRAHELRAMADCIAARTVVEVLG